MSDIVFICKICEEQFASKRRLFIHTKKTHNLNHKEYLDKIEGFHKCPFCEKERKWHGTYLRTCGATICKTQATEITTYEHFGVTNCSKSDKIKKQKAETTLLHYGVQIPAKSEIVKKKMQETCLENLGVINPYMQEKCKNKSRNTRIETHDEYVARIQETNRKNHGGILYQSTPAFSKDRRKRISYNENTFDSSWEVKLAEYCDKNDISYEYQPDISFTFFVNDKEMTYHPDFKINGMYFEVKGDHFFENGKMINPFDRTQDEIYEAKHQCMVANNVIILTGNDIKKLDKTLLNYINEENDV